MMPVMAIKIQETTRNAVKPEGSFLGLSWSEEKSARAKAEEFWLYPEGNRGWWGAEEGRGQVRLEVSVYFFFLSIFNLRTSLLLKTFYWFIWLHQVLVSARKIFSCGMWTLSCSMWDLDLWPGIEPGPSALGALSLSHWTMREVPRFEFLEVGWKMTRSKDKTGVREPVRGVL